MEDPLHDAASTLADSKGSWISFTTPRRLRGGPRAG